MGESDVDDVRAIRKERPVEALVAPLLTSFRRRKFVLLGLTFAALILLVTLGTVEQVLRDLHEPGGERAGTTALANDLLAWPDVQHFRDVLNAWRDTADLQSADSSAILATYAFVDIVFVLVYTLLAGMLLVMLKRELGPPEKVGQEDLTPYRRPVNVALIALGLLAAVDLAESVLILFSTLVSGTGGWAWVWSSLLWGAYRLKLLLVVAVLVPGIVAALTFLALRPGKRQGVWPAIAVARGQLLVITVLFLGLFVSDQAVDALRRWYEEPWDAFFATLMLAWLALFVLVSTIGLLDSAKQRRSGSESEGSFVVLALLVGCVAVVGWYFFGAWIGLATLAGLFLTLAVLGWLVESVPTSATGRELAGAHDWLPVTLGLLVLLFPVLGLVGAAVGPLVLGDFRFLWLALPTAIIVLLGLALFLWHEPVVRRWRLRRWRRGFLALTVLLIAFVAYRVVHDPWRASEAFGAITFLAAFLLALSLVFFVLVRRAEKVRPPDIVSIVRLRCTPVILLVVVWIAVTSTVDRETTYHDVRSLPASAAAQEQPRGVSATQGFEGWKGREAPSNTVRPMLFVAAAGGGIRAAYWTATVLTCVLEGQGSSDALPEACSEKGARANRRGPGSLFAASGISGGSLGLASYATHRTQDRGNRKWSESRLDDDYAAALVAWGLFVDLPSALVRRTGGSDRAEILERAFERSWLDGSNDDTTRALLWGGSTSTESSPLASGFLHQWTTQTAEAPLPILMLNGTKVQQGCRLNVSVLDTSVESANRNEAFVEDCVSLRLFELQNPKSRANWSLASSDDLLTYLCPDEDVRMSTAVMLSARFPWALPSGRLTRASEKPTGCKHLDVSPANIVDGGYFDTSGASPLVELWGAVAQDVSAANRNGACIVPYFLQIDTGYADPVRRGDSSPSELLVPPVTARRARDAREHNARQAAALLFSGAPDARVIPRAPPEKDPDIEDRYAHIYPRAHAGVRAPLGWTLSKAAREELEGQLEQNVAEIEKVRRWLADDRSCVRPEPPRGR